MPKSETRKKDHQGFVYVPESFICFVLDKLSGMYFCLCWHSPKKKRRREKSMLRQSSTKVVKSEQTPTLKGSTGMAVAWPADLSVSKFEIVLGFKIFKIVIFISCLENKTLHYYWTLIYFPTSQLFFLVTFDRNLGSVRKIIIDTVSGGKLNGQWLLSYEIRLGMSLN